MRPTLRPRAFRTKVEDGASAFPPDRYLTDGRRLFRIAGPAVEDDLVPVEDCNTLDVVLVPAAGLADLPLRAVVTLSPEPPSRPT